MAGIDLKKALSRDQFEELKQRDHPDWLTPMLAKLHHDPFSDEAWIYERKLDGERCLLFKYHDEVRLLSRNKKKLNDNYPELEEEAAAQDADNFVADGEIVAFSGKVTSFSRLQKRMHVSSRREAEDSGVAVYFYLFDLLYLDGYDLSELPLRQRKKLLKNLLDWRDPLRYTAHRNGKGKEYHAEACAKGWEGVMAKDGESTYVHSRSSKWLKFKCSHRQEFVIGGYTDPKGSRQGFGALLLGYYDDDRLRYAGKVGTGFDHEFLQKFGAKLERIERQKSPYDEEISDTRGVNWVSPKYVGEVAFTEWTGDGRLRHPRFVGLRRDKKPEKVVRED